MQGIYVAPVINDYIVRLVGSTRSNPELRLGASPRACVHLMRAARVEAALQGRDYVIPEDVVAVAESGVSNAHDVFEYAKWGADAVLVGEALVTSGNPLESIRDMVSAGAHPALLTDRKARVRQALQEG